MATNFPTSLDNNTNLPNPTGTNTQNSPDHASQHSNENDALKAIETKLGTGSSTASSGTVLRGTGSGASAFAQVNVTTDVAGFTSANLRTLLSDETGSGSAVFANTPTLITPAVDTITESTPSNGVTVAGLSIKSSKLNTNNSVVTANITNAAVTADKLATGAATATVATSETTTSTSFADLTTTTDSVTVTIGANGLALITVSADASNSGANVTNVDFALTGANTRSASDTTALKNPTTTVYGRSRMTLLTALSAGSTTFKMKYRVAAGTGTFLNRSIVVVPL